MGDITVTLGGDGRTSRVKTRGPISHINLPWPDMCYVDIAHNLIYSLVGIIVSSHVATPFSTSERSCCCVYLWFLGADWIVSLRVHSEPGGVVYIRNRSYS